jgi:hypothetical protein
MFLRIQRSMFSVTERISSNEIFVRIIDDDDENVEEMEWKCK